VLDFRHKPYGWRIFVDDINEALEKIGYTLKERDIVLRRSLEELSSANLQFTPPTSSEEMNP